MSALVALFGVDANLDVVLLVVDVDRKILELVDELVDVLGLDLTQIEVRQYVK